MLPGVMTHSALLSACAKSKQTVRALEVFEAMKLQATLPDVIIAVGVNPWIAAGDGLSVAGARCDELQCSHYHLREG